MRNDDRKVVNVDYVIADLWQLQQYQVAFDDERQLLQQSIALIDQLSGNREYGIIGFKDGVILMQKAAASEPLATDAWLAFRQSALAS